jgi:hypothetical protein
MLALQLPALAGTAVAAWPGDVDQHHRLPRLARTSRPQGNTLRRMGPTGQDRANCNVKGGSVCRYKSPSQDQVRQAG